MPLRTPAIGSGASGRWLLADRDARDQARNRSFADSSSANIRSLRCLTEGFEKGLIVSCHKMVTLSGPIHFRDRWHSPVGPLPIGSACSVEDSKKKSTLPRFNGSSGSRPSTTRWRWRWPRGILFFRYSVVSAIEFQPSLSFR